MANRSPNPGSKPYKQNQAPASINKKRVVIKTQKTLKKPQGQVPVEGSQKAVRPVLRRKSKVNKTASKLVSIVAIAVLLGSAGLVSAFAWLSIELIFNPDKITWVNQFIPGWLKFSLNQGERPQSLLEIQADFQKQGWLAGEILPLDGKKTESFLLPAFKQRANCQSNCKQIVELRVYQRSQNPDLQSKPEKYYNLLTQLPITGLEESFVLTPLVNVASDYQDSSTILPIGEIGRFDSKAASPGIWFYLRGKRQQGTAAIAYGHIVHYNPERTHLQLMLSWTSPSGQLPQWRQVTGSKTKELVVDQTVGLEPQLRIYQVKPVKLLLNPVQLEEISLQPPALNDSAYKNALLIARNRLWTPALEWLQFIQKQRRKPIPAAAQAQIDVIRLHSQFTKTQADTTWASPSQQVLANLIDGRWGKALRIFEASPQNAQEIAVLLKADTGRLWSRVEAALQVNPNRPEVQAWGALTLATQHGEERANSWLKKQTKITKESLTYIQRLLAQLNSATELSKIIPTHPSRILGSVQAIATVNSADWLQPNNVETRHGASLQKANNQVWYQVEVTAFHNGKNWLYSPFVKLNSSKTSPAKFLWDNLGLNSDPTIQIVVWQENGEQQIITATIKAVQLRGRVLRLLATADAKISQADNNTQSPALALTTAALEWVQPSPITLEQLHQQNEKRVKTILPTVWRTLQTSGQLPSGNLPNFPQMLQNIGHWPVQEIDFTGNNKPETVLTISAEAIKSLNQTLNSQQEPNQSRPRTLILSDNGNLIYSDFSNNSDKFLTAITKLATTNYLALLVENSNSYSLKRWSGKKQRFE